MECRLVLNNKTKNEISNKDMSDWIHQLLKFRKFRRVRSRNGKSLFYLFFYREEDTYAALRAAKSIKGFSLKRYCPTNTIDSELPFRPFPPQHIIDVPRFAFKCHLDKFTSIVCTRNS